MVSVVGVPVVRGRTTAAAEAGRAEERARRPTVAREASMKGEAVEGDLCDRKGAGQVESQRWDARRGRKGRGEERGRWRRKEGGVEDEGQDATSQPWCLLRDLG